MTTNSGSPYTNEVASELRHQLELLTGQRCGEGTSLPPKVATLLTARGSGIGHSQLNELLMLLGFDRISSKMFQFLVDGGIDYKPGSAIGSMERLEEGVERFRILALFVYGNVKYGFKALSRDDEELVRKVSSRRPNGDSGFRLRHDPVLALNDIPKENTHLLGYLTQKEILQYFKADPSDAAAAKAKEDMDRVEVLGRENHLAYLAADHLDVYVATSMRTEHEYHSVSDTISQVFAHAKLRQLKLRWFDPTQAYCSSRIDKGIAEALMLKRASCTLYIVGETDTLGKDSELASTLAQGKPVVAYVPTVDDGFAGKLINELAELYPHTSLSRLIINQLQRFYPAGAWSDDRVRSWVANEESIDNDQAIGFLNDKIRSHYDARAQTLKELHPLGIQVNIATGVPNGVLVCRGIDEAAKLLRCVLTNEWELEIDEDEDSALLKEVTSGCVFRVMTREPLLTNAYWNYYGERMQNTTT